MAEYVTPKYVTLAWRLFWFKGTWKAAGARKALWPPFFFLKAGDKIPMWNMSSLYQKERNIRITRDRESRLREFCTDIIKMTFVFLSSLHIFYFSTIASLCSVSYIALRFCQSFGRLPGHIKLIRNKTECFSFANLSFVTDPQLRPKIGRRKIFSSPTQLKTSF